MPTLNEIDLPQITNNSVRDVFATMLSMELDAATVGGASTVPIEDGIIGFVGVAGPVQGAVYLHVGETFARCMAATMLGLQSEELGASDVNDVIGELTNMIGGNIKSRLNDAGLKCNLSVPSVVRGQNLDVKTSDLESGCRHEGGFAHQGNLARVVVAVKDGPLDI